MKAESGLQILVSKAKIDATVKRLAAQIRADYAGEYPLLVGVLKGSFIFMADLVRSLNIPLQVDFIRLASYGTATRSSGKIALVHELSCIIQDRHVLVVEDIVDTGLTTAFLLDYLRGKGPASLKLCALADKSPRRQVPVKIDYSGFTVPDKFLVGYGLDWNERYRYLPCICVVEEKE